MLVSRKERPTGDLMFIYIFCYNAHVHAAENVQLRPLGPHFSVGRQHQQQFPPFPLRVLYGWVSSSTREWVNASFRKHGLTTRHLKTGWKLWWEMAEKLFARCAKKRSVWHGTALKRLNHTTLRAFTSSGFVRRGSSSLLVVCAGHTIHSRSRLVQCRSHPLLQRTVIFSHTLARIYDIISRSRPQMPARMDVHFLSQESPVHWLGENERAHNSLGYQYW